MTCLGVLERGERGDDNETGLKEGGGIEIEIAMLHLHAALSLDLLTHQTLLPKQWFFSSLICDKLVSNKFAACVN